MADLLYEEKDERASLYGGYVGITTTIIGYTVAIGITIVKVLKGKGVPAADKLLLSICGPPIIGMFTSAITYTMLTNEDTQKKILDKMANAMGDDHNKNYNKDYQKRIDNNRKSTENMRNDRINHQYKHDMANHVYRNGSLPTTTQKH